MIGSLRGTLLERGADDVLIEVAGIGYRVHVDPDLSGALGELGGEVFVHIHHHIREDAQVLYGFPDGASRKAFVALLSAHGVGPALAQSILSVHGADDLRTVLATDDLDALCLVPGVGKKTAARLLVELKSKLDLPDGDLAATIATVSDAPKGGVRRDLRDALSGLGYGDAEIQHVLRDLPEGDDVSVLLKDALRRLAVAP